MTVKKIAVVGTREPTPEGASLARKAGAEVARRGHVLVSGGAPGVDVEAMLGALEAGGAVYVVLPWCIPPPEPLQRLLKESPSILVECIEAERPRALGARNELFRRRTIRVVDMSDAVVVAEAKTPSGGRGWGTYLAVKHAVKLGKPIYILKPSSGDPSVREAYRILVELGAKPIADVSSLPF